MNIQRLTITLTLFNLILLAFGLAQLRPAVAQGVAPVLRARALEIVDDQGRVRAEIKVLRHNRRSRWATARPGIRRQCSCAWSARRTART